MEAELLRTANAYLCQVIKVPLWTKGPTTGVGAFATMTIKKDDFVGLHYTTIVYEQLSLRQRARMVDNDGALEADLARFSKCVPQLRVQGRCFYQIKERLRNGKAVFCTPALFYICG